MAATTTIRLPPKWRARIAALAKQTGRSAVSIIARYHPLERFRRKALGALVELLPRGGERRRCEAATAGRAPAVPRHVSGPPICSG